MKWLMSLHEAGTGLSGDIRLGDVGEFGFIKELHSVTNRLGASRSIIEDLPRDLSKPRGSYT